jgi:hypothetical protein
VDNILESLEKQLHEKLGVSPRGKLRIKFYSQGSSAYPEIDQQRTLEVLAYDPELGDIQALRAQLTAERNENFRLHERLDAAHGRLMEFITGQNTIFAQITQGYTVLATTRGQVQAGAEAGTLQSVVGAVMLVGLLPLLREAFDVPDDLPLGEVVRLMGMRLRKMILGNATLRKNQALPGSDPPAALETGTSEKFEAELYDEAGEGGDEPKNAPPPPAPTPRPSPEQVIAWVKEDPLWGLLMWDQLKSTPGLMARVLEAR